MAVADSPMGCVPFDGILFDIDDTLVDLETAMGTTVQHVSGSTLLHFSDNDWVEYKRHYTSDPQGYYDRFLAGELSFTGQRIARIRHAHELFGAYPLDDAAAQAWNSEYEKTLPLHFRTFDDVIPLLNRLDADGIPYGAVSNNVHDYQRNKLNLAGLDRMKVLVGIDTVGVAKPDPAIFREGARRIGTDPSRTLYVGDNRLVDAVGASDAGLVGIWLDRHQSPVAEFDGYRVESLSALLHGSAFCHSAP